MKKIIMGIVMMFAIQSSLNAETPTEESVAKIYVATYNRAPDARGLDYWLNSSNLSLEEISQSFFDQPETQRTYPLDSTNTDFVSAVYPNLFNRQSEQEGIDYWVAELDSGRIAKSNFILAVINGAQDTEEFGNDATILANKTQVGLTFARLGLTDVADATSIMKYVTDDSSSIRVPFLVGQANDTSCTFSYKTIMGMKISNPTCEQKWNLWNYLTLGSTILRNDFMALYAQYEGVLSTKEDRDAFINVVKSTIDVVNIITTKGSTTATKAAISMAVSNNITRYIPHESGAAEAAIQTKDILVTSIGNYYTQVTSGKSSPAVFWLSVAIELESIGFTFYDVYMLNGIVENLNEINIAQEYLYRYYQLGGNTPAVDKYFTGNDTSWSREFIIDAVAATMHLSNGLFSEAYNYEKVLEIINYYKDDFIPEITNITMNGDSDDENLLNGKILQEDDKWEAEIKIGTLVENQKSATIDFRALNCGGDLTYSSQADGGYLFLETITYGSCVQDCTLWLKEDGSEYKEFCNGSLAGYGNLHEV